MGRDEAVLRSRDPEGRAPEIRNPEIRNSETGFSLIEIMVGMAILLIGLMTLGASMVVSYRLDRSTNERKAALSFAASQIERVRGMTYLNVGSRPRVNNANPADPMGAGGYLPDPAWGSVNVGGNPSSGVVGFRQDLDGDGDVDLFGLHYYRQTMSGSYRVPRYTSLPNGWYVTISDPRLDVLTPDPAMGGRVAQIAIRDSDASTGLVEGSGYWVTVRVFWLGSGGGREEAKMSTFIAR